MYRSLANCILALERGVAASDRPEDHKLAADHMAALAPILAAAVLGKNLLPRIRSMERLFGTTVIDVGPFEEAFAQWRHFLVEYESFAVSGMTMNERLEALGLLADFDAAALEGNRRTLRSILEKAHLSADDIDRILQDVDRHRGAL